MPLIPEALFDEVYEAAIETKLYDDRDTVLSGLPKGYVGQLSSEKGAKPGSLLLKDLRELNEQTELRDGSLPLIRWLQNAKKLTKDFSEYVIFRKALHFLNKGGPLQVCIFHSSDSTLQEDILSFVTHVRKDQACNGVIELQTHALDEKEAEEITTLLDTNDIIVIFTGPDSDSQWEERLTAPLDTKLKANDDAFTTDHVIPVLLNDALRPQRTLPDTLMQLIWSVLQTPFASPDNYRELLCRLFGESVTTQMGSAETRDTGHYILNIKGKISKEKAMAFLAYIAKELEGEDIQIKDASAGSIKFVIKASERGRNKLEELLGNADSENLKDLQIGGLLQMPPYRGLQYFDVDDSHLFFGRGAAIGWLIESLRPDYKNQTRRFLAIVGPSGSGKSSLARAGLLADLQHGGIRESGALSKEKWKGSEEWNYTICRPGEHPIQQLQQALASTIKQPATNPEQQDPHPETWLTDWTTTHLGDKEKRWIILVDQFEELLTLCKSEVERKQYINMLHHASTRANGQVIIILTLRADFYNEYARYPRLASLMTHNQFIISPMGRSELRRSIEEPAARTDTIIEKKLVSQLVEDVERSSAPLPLLQYVLLHLWERRHDNTMTLQDYNDLGGMTGALEKHAEAIYSTLPPEEKPICRYIFIRLTTRLGEDPDNQVFQAAANAPDTKRRIPIHALMSPNFPNEQIQSVLQRLIQARLLTSAGQLTLEDKIDLVTFTWDKIRDNYVELAHESMLQAWPRLQTWLDEDRQPSAVRRQLALAIKDWKNETNETKKNGFLLRGSLLELAEELRHKKQLGLNEEEAEFLRLSTQQQQNEEEEKKSNPLRTTNQ